MTGQQMVDRINQAGYGFRVERPGAGWDAPWVAINRETGHASPMSHHDLLVKHQQLFGVSDAAAILGRKGGQARTERQTEARRLNGRKGGRPRKGSRRVPSV